MSFDSDQFREAITQTLNIAAEITSKPLATESAIELLMLTAAQESHLGRYIEQVHGPADGVFQMEPRTLADVIDWCKRHKGFESLPELYANEVGDYSDDATLNLPFQIVMARVYYWRKTDPLPPVENIEGLAYYWKKHFNTFLGAGRVCEAEENYRKYALK
jgi:hypothetical protein